MMRPLFLALVSVAPTAAAHEVHLRQEPVTMTVVTLTYADGKPFAYEQFEVTPPGAQAPSQVGRTDAQGRAAVLPVPGQALELVATAKDGHGARITLPAGDVATAAPRVADETPRWMSLATGAGVLFGAFGLLQLFVRSRRSGS